MKRNTGLKMFCLFVPVLVGPSLAWAQQTGEVLYPDDRVTGGAIAARRPGLIVAGAIAQHRERLVSVLQNHGGAQPQTGDPNDERHVFLLTTFLQGIFDVAQNIANALLLAAQVSGTTGT